MNRKDEEVRKFLQEKHDPQAAENPFGIRPIFRPAVHWLGRIRWPRKWRARMTSCDNVTFGRARLKIF